MSADGVEYRGGEVIVKAEGCCAVGCICICGCNSCNFNVVVAVKSFNNKFEAVGVKPLSARDGLGAVVDQNGCICCFRVIGVDECNV